MNAFINLTLKLGHNIRVYTWDRATGLESNLSQVCLIIRTHAMPGLSRLFQGHTTVDFSVLRRT